MKIFYLSLFVFCSLSCFAQLPPIRWERSLGGEADDVCYSLQQTKDGGYIAAGQSNSLGGDVNVVHGSYDYWVVKLSDTGGIQWQRCLGGHGIQKAYAVQQTKGGGYIVAGTSLDTANGDITTVFGGYDYWIVKLDDTGTITWQKSYGGTGDDIPAAIIQTSDSGYLVVGISDSATGQVTTNKGHKDIWVIKLDDTGALQWQRSLGGSADDFASSVVQTSDGGYAIAGYTFSNDSDVSGNHGGNDAWIVKLNAAGVIQWQKALGGTQGDGASSLIQTSDGSLVFAGFSYSRDGDLTDNLGHSDFWVGKLSSSGSLQWQSSFGGLSYEQAQSIEQTTDGGYVVAGWTNSNDVDVFGNNGGSDYWMVKLNATGTIQWRRCLGGFGTDQAFAVHQTPDAGFIVAGVSNSNNDDVTNNHPKADGSNTNDFWIAKVNAMSDVKETSSTAAITITPNPTFNDIYVHGTDKVNIEVYNLLGQQMVRATNTNSASMGELPAGMYFVKLINTRGELLKQEKIVKQ